MNMPKSWRTEKQTSAERGYGPRWRRARAIFLKAHPLCVFCKRDGHLTPALVVDHITPHEGDEELFWDRNNWQSLCKFHHDGEKAEIEGRHQPRAKFSPDGRVIW